MLGHLDPELHDILLDLVAMLRRVYRAESGMVLPLQSTGTSGMEAGIANLVERGDTVIVGASGFFGKRIAEVARRSGADVVEVTAEWGRHVPNARAARRARRAPSRAPARGRPRGRPRPAASIRSPSSVPRCGAAGRS